MTCCLLGWQPVDSLVWSPLVPDRSILAGELAGWAGLPPVGLSGCPDTSMSTLRAVESEITKLERLDGIKYVEKKTSILITVMVMLRNSHNQN